MEVSELIELLSRFPQTARVINYEQLQVKTKKDYEGENWWCFDSEELPDFGES